MTREEGDLLYGITPVQSALEEAPERVHKLYAAEGRRDGRVEALLSLAREDGIPVAFQPPGALDRLTDGASHQGVAARVAATVYEDPMELVTAVKALGEVPLLVALDHLQDPQNLGAVARSVEAMGAHGLVVPRYRSAAPGAGAEKASAGALQRVSLCRAANLARTLELLKEEGLWVVGTAAEEGTEPWGLDLTGPLCLVIGAEEKGVRPITRKACDMMAAIPLAGRTASLNASAAAGMMLYEIVRQRRDAAHGPGG
ncbi:MAG: 23S rRNA (guanosine(2251)-2'-O)-methyltransferase RlmB [bacterium]